MTMNATKAEVLTKDAGRAIGWMRAHINGGAGVRLSDVGNRAILAFIDNMDSELTSLRASRDEAVKERDEWKSHAILKDCKQCHGEGTTIDSSEGGIRILCDCYAVRSQEYWNRIGELERALAQAERDGVDVSAKVARLEGEIERLKDVLHRDQTGLARGLEEVVKTVRGYEWVATSRGSYEWDDDEYRKEMGRMLDAVKKISVDSLQASGDLAHRECCGRGRNAALAQVSAPAPAPAKETGVYKWKCRSCGRTQPDTGCTYNGLGEAHCLSCGESCELLKPSASPAPSREQAPFQSRVVNWMMECFSNEICRDTTERNHRFLEESLELVQSLGCTQSEAHQLVDYVFSRPKGEPVQEAGGVMVTLAALCNAACLDMAESGEVELKRVWSKIDVIRAKQAAKPKHSPLPAPAAPATSGTGEQYEGVRVWRSDLYEWIHGPKSSCCIDRETGAIVKSMCSTNNLNRAVPELHGPERLAVIEKALKLKPDLFGDPKPIPASERIHELEERVSELERGNQTARLFIGSIKLSLDNALAALDASKGKVKP